MFHSSAEPISDGSIAEALVILFSVIVLDVLGHRATEVLAPDRNQPLEAFFLDRIRVGSRVGILSRMNLRG